MVVWLCGCEQVDGDGGFSLRSLHLDVGLFVEGDKESQISGLVKVADLLLTSRGENGTQRPNRCLVRDCQVV